MTKIEHPISRVGRRCLMHYRKPIVISLEPGDVVAVRLLRTPARRAYRIALEDLYVSLAKVHAMAARRERQNRKNKK